MTSTKETKPCGNRDHSISNLFALPIVTLDENGATQTIHPQHGVWHAGLHPDDVGRELRPFPPPMTRFERIILSNMCGDILFVATMLLIGVAIYGVSGGRFTLE